jgi:SulP family sulfate permease
MALLKKYAPQVPGALTAMIASSVVVGLFGLENYGVLVLGELPRNLPPLADIPLTDFNLMSQMAAGAFAIAAIGLVEAMSIARSIAAQSGERLDSNQEFVGQGLSNVAAGMFSGYTCSGSFTRSAVNFTAGARTAMASVYSGLLVLAAMLIFAPYAAYLPRTALAGVLIVTAYGMVDRTEMKRIWQASIGDSAIMIATLAATLLLPLQFAVLSGIIVSIIRFMVKTSTPQVQAVVPDENFQHFVGVEQHPVCPQLAVISVSGALYFGATQHVENVIRNNNDRFPEQRFLLLRMQLVDHCDVSGIHMLESIVRMYRQKNGDVYMDGVREPVMEQMKSIGFDKMLGHDHFLARLESVSHIFHHVLEPSVCIYECSERVFAECQALPKFEYGQRIAEAASLPEVEIPAWLPSQLRDELGHKTVGADILLIDVREPREYQRGHVPNAVLMPMRTVPKRGEELPKDLPIVVICRIGRRSRLAGTILKNMGHDNVYNLQGGILAWEAAGYPLAVEP